MKSNLGKVKYCVCVLTRGYQYKIQYGDLIRRNNAISDALKGEDVNCNMVIFHEGDIDVEQQSYIREKSKNQEIIFKNVESYFSRVKYNSNSSSNWCCRTDLSDSFSDGYKTMCRFWIEGIFQYTKGYDYIVRIDEDCIVKQLPLYQMTCKMIRNNNYFGTAISLDEEDPNVKVGFDDFVDSLYAERGRTAGPRHPIPNTNFMMIDRKIFENQLINKFMSKIVETNCIYINRWGDTILWGGAIAYAFDSYRIEHMEEVKYIHGSFGGGVNCKISLSDRAVLFLSKIIKYYFSKIN